MTEEGQQDTAATPQVTAAANGGRRGNVRRRRNGRNGVAGKAPTTTNSNKDPETVTTPTVTKDEGGPTPSTKVLEATNTNSPSTSKRTNPRRRNRGRNATKPANVMNGQGEAGDVPTTEPSISLVVEPDIVITPNRNSNGNDNDQNKQNRQKTRRNRKKVAPTTTTDAASATIKEESNGDSGSKEIPEVVNPDGTVSSSTAIGIPQQKIGKKGRNRKGKTPKQGNPTPDGTQVVTVKSEDAPAPANAANNGKGATKNPRNESFDPTLTMVRPSLRVCVASAENKTYNKQVSHDDVIVVPDLFGKEDDWSLYNNLVEEFGQLEEDQINGAKLKSLYKGAHMVATNPSISKTFQDVVNKICQYFQIKPSSSRLDWYRDSKDWKPFHHDSAAYNKNHAKKQNLAVMVSFGASRELAFLKSDVGESVEAGSNPDTRCRIYFPQPNNCCISFGQDVNLHFKHAINALPDNQQDGKGRISILVWGWTDNVSSNENAMPGNVANDLATSQPAKKENEETKKTKNRRNLKRKNLRGKKGAAQNQDENNVPAAENTPDTVIHA